MKLATYMAGIYLVSFQTYLVSTFHVVKHINVRYIKPVSIGSVSVNCMWSRLEYFTHVRPHPKIGVGAGNEAVCVCVCVLGGWAGCIWIHTRVCVHEWWYWLMNCISWQTCVCRVAHCARPLFHWSDSCHHYQCHLCLCTFTEWTSCKYVVMESFSVDELQVELCPGLNSWIVRDNYFWL